MRHFVMGKRILLSSAPAILGLDSGTNAPLSKTYKSFAERTPSDETGMDRLKKMFQIDEFGGISSELNSIYQGGFLGFLVGSLYGGVLHSRGAYMNFMENNEATAFKSHLDAKRKLQDQFTVNFAKGGFKWGWRVGLFTTTYLGIVTCVSVYREKSSIYEYLAAGSLTGSLYKFSLGLRGMIAGAIIGGAIGGVAGCASLLILKASGTSMEEVRYWQYKWKLDRDTTVRDAFKSQEEPKSTLMENHDEKVGVEKLDLKSI